MKPVVILLMLAASLQSFAQETKPAPTLKSILLEQLRTTHNEKDWFVPANIAIEGITPEQAKWTDGSGNHSIGQLGRCREAARRGPHRLGENGRGFRRRPDE